MAWWRASACQVKSVRATQSARVAKYGITNASLIPGQSLSRFILFSSTVLLCSQHVCASLPSLLSGPDFAPFLVFRPGIWPRRILLFARPDGEPQKTTQRRMKMSHGLKQMAIIIKMGPLFPAKFVSLVRSRPAATRTVGYLD